MLTDGIPILIDGIPEIELDSGRLFGLSRCARLCEKTLEMPLAEAGRRTLEPAREANGSRTQADDWTFVLIERTARKTLEPAATTQGV